MRSGARGPTLLEDFILREKNTHFDHERIPERIVHVRGSSPDRNIEADKSLSDLSRAAFLCSGFQKPVFARFSTGPGRVCSVNLPGDDVRGFGDRFHTQEDNFDLVATKFQCASFRTRSRFRILYRR